MKTAGITDAGYSTSHSISPWNGRSRPTHSKGMRNSLAAARRLSHELPTISVCGALVSEFVADALIRQFYGVEYEFAREQIGSAKAHRFSQDSIYLGERQLLRL